MTDALGSWTEAAEKFGGLLRRLRGQAGLTQEALGTKIGLSKARISEIENGKFKKPLDRVLIANWEKECSPQAQTARTGGYPSPKVRQQASDLEQLYYQPRDQRHGTDLRSGIPHGRPLTSWNPIRLGVHKAITIAGAVDLPVLPPYVERAHDRRLRTLLSTVSSNMCVVVTGGSSVGKSRSMWEAVLACLADWNVVRPDSGTNLVRLTEAGVAPRTVLWLDELHDHLLDNAEGEAAAEALLTLLDAPGPYAVIGSMWPRHWSELASRPDRGADRHRLARELLANYAEEVPLPESFLDERGARDLLQRLAEQDPRLAIACKTAGGNWAVTQVLSGGTHLVNRFERGGDAQGTAIIAVALDAWRLGFHGPYTHGFFHKAIEDYLPSAQRVDEYDWLERALAYASEEVQGVAALTPVRREPGVGAADGFDLHHYLAQHGEQTRQNRRVPASLWDTLAFEGRSAGSESDHVSAAAHVHNPETLYRLGSTARTRMLYLHAERFLQRAADTGYTNAHLELADLYSHQERHGESEEQLRLAVPTQPHAHVAHAERLSRRGLIDDAVTAYLAGYEAYVAMGHAEAGFHVRAHMAEMLSENDRVDEALAEWRAISDSGLVLDRSSFARLLANRGRLSEAITELRKDIAVGNTLARSHLIHLLTTHDRVDEAIAEIATAAPGEFGCDAVHLSHHLVRLGRKDQAIAGLRAAANRGDLLARCTLGSRMEKDGHIPAAISEYRIAAESGHGTARDDLIRILKKQGRHDEAHAVARAAIDSLCDAAEAGDAWARIQRASLYVKVGETDKAISEARIAADSGDHGAGWYLARLLEIHGHFEDATAEMTTAGQTGILNVRHELPRLLTAQGQDDLAWVVGRYGLNPDGSPNRPSNE